MESSTQIHNLLMIMLILTLGNDQVFHRRFGRAWRNEAYDRVVQERKARNEADVGIHKCYRAPANHPMNPPQPVPAKERGIVVKRGHIHSSKQKFQVKCVAGFTITNTLVNGKLKTFHSAIWLLVITIIIAFSAAHPDWLTGWLWWIKVWFTVLLAYEFTSSSRVEIFHRLPDLKSGLGLSRIIRYWRNLSD